MESGSLLSSRGGPVQFVDPLPSNGKGRVGEFVRSPCVRDVPMNGVARNEDATDGDDDTSRLLYRMPIQERNLLYDEIHGVSEFVQEAPEFVEERLKKFQVLLDRIATKPAYSLARLLSPEFVNDRSLRFQALRAE